MSDRVRLLPLVLGLAWAGGAGGGELPGALVVLEAHGPMVPGYVPQAAPPRFVLLEDGQVFVGGTSQVRAGRLEGKDQKALDKQLGDVRKLSGLAGSVRMGPGDQRYRLVLRKGRPLDMSVSGDPARAEPAFRGLAVLLQDLLRFDHPSLRPFAPTSYALSAREGRLPGGCRAWPFADPPSTFVPRVVPAEEVVHWPKGAAPASVCLGDKAFTVLLRPLLPGEQP
jgi:hypothetical protein